MPQVFSNNAETTLANQLAIGATSMTVASGQGARFQAPTGGDFELITLIASDTDYEVVKSTARVGDVFTIERGVEGTARQWEVGEAVSGRITAQGLGNVGIADPITGKTLGPNTEAITEDAALTGAYNVSLATYGVHKVHITGSGANINFPTGLSTGKLHRFSLIMSSNLSFYTFNFSTATNATIKWPEGTAPSPNWGFGGGGTWLFNFTTIDGGTTWFGFTAMAGGS